MIDCIRIEPDPKAPTAAIELAIRHPLPDYDLQAIEGFVPREVDPMLASQGFHDLIDEARSVLAGVLPGSNLETVQLTGAICSAPGARTAYTPGLWLVLRETGASPGAPMSAAAQARAAAIAEALCAALQLK